MKSNPNQSAQTVTWVTDYDQYGNVICCMDRVGGRIGHYTETQYPLQNGEYTFHTTTLTRERVKTDREWNFIEQKNLHDIKLDYHKYDDSRVQKHTSDCYGKYPSIHKSTDKSIPCDLCTFTWGIKRG